jgi:hypothetical protein
MKRAMLSAVMLSGCMHAPVVVELNDWRIIADNSCELRLGDGYVTSAKFASELVLKQPGAKNVELRTARDMPYRCISEFIYVSQRSGIKRIRFIPQK